MRIIKKMKYQKGFGILEVMISSMILVTVVGAVVALGSASVRGGLSASDKTTAYNLVQECLETARAVRDTAWIDGDSATDWNSSFVSNLGTSICPAEVIIGTPEVKYTRTITTEEVSWYGGTTGPKYGVITSPIFIPKNKTRKISVEVKWMGESGERKLIGSTYLTDWKAIN